MELLVPVKCFLCNKQGDSDRTHCKDASKTLKKLDEEVQGLTTGLPHRDIFTLSSFSLLVQELFSFLGESEAKSEAFSSDEVEPRIGDRTPVHGRIPSTKANKK